MLELNDELLKSFHKDVYVKERCLEAGWSLGWKRRWVLEFFDSFETPTIKNLPLFIPFY